jgi:hypothetical protein
MRRGLSAVSRTAHDLQQWLWSCPLLPKRGLLSSDPTEKQRSLGYLLGRLPLLSESSLSYYPCLEVCQEKHTHVK